jgi:hypothetical protein
MNRGAIRHDRELLGEANEIDHGAIGFIPIGSAIRNSALLAGGLIGDGKGGDEKILNRATHARVIAENCRTE